MGYEFWVSVICLSSMSGFLWFNIGRLHRSILSSDNERWQMENQRSEIFAGRIKEIDSILDRMKHLEESSRRIRVSIAPPVQKPVSTGNKRKRTQEERKILSEKAKARWALKKLKQQQAASAQDPLVKDRINKHS